MWNSNLEKNAYWMHSFYNCYAVIYGYGYVLLCFKKNQHYYAASITKSQFLGN